MRELVGPNAAGRLRLKAIIPHGRRGRETLLDVALLEEPPLRGAVSPDAGEAVRLKLERHRKLIRRTRPRLLHLPHALFDAKEVLYVMAELVRDHVRLREIAGRAEALIELVEEAEVEVDLLIDWALEWADCRRSLAAPRAHGLAKNGELRVAILLTVHLGEQLRPRLLDIVEHEGDELNSFLLCRRATHRLLRIARSGLRWYRTSAAAIEDVHAEDEGQNERDHCAADPHPAPA